jgi:Protein of unknown function (DUF3302)
MLDGFDWFFDIAAIVLLAAILLVACIVLILLGSLPGAIAKKRNHPQADAVTALGWVGLIFVFCWPIAIAWAFVGTPTGIAIKERKE